MKVFLALVLCLALAGCCTVKCGFSTEISRDELAPPVK